MKKYLFAMIFAAVVFCSCAKDNSFSKEQNSDVKYPCLYASINTKCVIGADDKTISWQKGDNISVIGSVLTEDPLKYEKACFYAASDEDAAAGKFTFKEMLVGESLTSIQWAEKWPDSWVDFNNQTYDGRFPAMLKTSSVNGNQLVFANNPDYPNGYIKLTFTGDKTIDRLIVKRTASGTTKTMNLRLNPAITLDAGGKSVYFTVPEGEYTSIEVRAYDTANGFMSVSTTSTKTIASGKVSRFPGISYLATGEVYPGSNLEAIAIEETVGGETKTVIWAPVNCGYSAEHPCGLMYQFGRATGTSYYPASAADAKTAGIQNAGTLPALSELADGVFYDKWTISTNWPIKSTDDGYVAGKVSNPCPEGWRVPTPEEFAGLVANFEKFGTWSYSTGGTDAEKEARAMNFGWACKGNNAALPLEQSVKLIPAGYRAATTSYGRGHDSNARGTYWSSKNYSRTICNPSSGISTSNTTNANAYPVRCVKIVAE